MVLYHPEIQCKSVLLLSDIGQRNHSSSPDISAPVIISLEVTLSPLPSHRISIYLKKRYMLIYRFATGRTATSRSKFGN